MYAQLAGSVKVWAQNGMVWEVHFTDGTTQEAVTSSVPIMVINKMMADFEKEYPDGPPQVENEYPDESKDEWTDEDEAAAEALLSKDEVQGVDGPDTNVDPPADEPTGSDLEGVVVGKNEAGEIVTANTPEEFLDKTVDENFDGETKEETPDETETPKG